MSIFLRLVALVGLFAISFAGCASEEETNAAIIADGGSLFPMGGMSGNDVDAGDDTLDAAVPTTPACNDGEDNDGDGKIDFPDDPGCMNAADRNETDPSLPACSDSADNDDDGLVDFPNDPGCSSAEDTDETDEMAAPRPQCANGRDDDGDGLVDIADPGCISEADPRESGANDDTECMSDEDCASYGTCVLNINRCVPRCSNRIDDDGDGIIDFPLEPGCAGAGDDDETDPSVSPSCGNGLDDDSDGLVDYPNDPGCAGVGDRDELDPDRLPACGDGRDNDNDGTTDYPEDRGCESAADHSEGGACGRLYEAVEVTPGEVIRGDSRQGPYSSEGTCGGRGAPEVVLVYRVTKPIEAFVVRTDLDANEHQTTLHIRRNCLDANTEIGCAREPSQDGIASNQLRIENPLLGDHYIFVDGAAGEGGRFAVVVEEIELAQCLNGIDDDGDGQTDYPYDPGCELASDRDETTPEMLPVCFDGLDNDFDGRTDFPLDAGCISAAHDNETEQCGTGLRISSYPVGAPFVTGRSDDGTASNSFAGTCGQGLGLEKVYLYRNPFNARLDISVDFPETAPQTEIYVRRVCVSPASEVACNEGSEENGQRGSLTIPQASPGDYYIFVDHPNAGVNGAYKLAVTAERLEPSCSDGADNDDDGFIDADDPGCSSLDDEDERDGPNLPLRPQCDDGVDNDDDGEIDYPFDPGCVTRGTDDETDPDAVAQCNNGVDDDDDGVIDFPADSGCASRADDVEENGRRPSQCSNRIDDDADGLVDYPNDPGCVAIGDLSERDDAIPPACADGIDNDDDNRIDYPYEPGCIAAGDRDESDPADLPACSNGIDDDGDDVRDFPLEPGCAAASDNDESDSAFPPQCANGQDDDQNGRTDFPDDPGCRFAGDLRETTEGDARTRCNDGVDNDLDGAVDLADPGCSRSLDNDETDPAAVGLCGDGVDNDGDGQVDWPDDEGCAAVGDTCEQAGFGLCDGMCQDIQTNDLHCGRCDRRCPPGVSCVDGRCGEIRRRFRLCGQAFNYRAAANYRRERLAAANVIAESSCQPGDDVQAVLITYAGRLNVTNAPQQYMDYLERGGQLITSRQTSHDIYNALFGADVSRPPLRRGGQCQGNIQNVRQSSPDDGFWVDTPFIPISANLTGCGYAINNLPDVTLLAGWNENEASLGYLDVGAGRIWFVESNWFEQRDTFTELSFYMMESMILGSGSGGLPPCLDGIDNDGDGAIDLFDSGCTGREDPIEDDSAEDTECADGLDNDSDGIIDYPFDTGCLAAGDLSETSPDEVPQCANGLDDDNDGKPDYPNDPGCSSRADDVETDEERRARCANGRDDDADGLIDFPADPGCSAAVDEDEEDAAIRPACANGRDDDRDGIADWPFDPGCSSAADDDESDEAVPPSCFNGIDDDGDGLVDFPADPGCLSAGDPLEDTGGPVPACANGVDDDEDQLIDFPADRGCAYAADDDELDPFRIPARCNDGVDNDGDGIIDLSDPGCIDQEDDDEVDGDEAPLCGNEVDDDQDGLIDWPADPGCQARGDTGEDQACGDVADVVLIPQNGTVDGETLEDGPDRYKSLRCGGNGAAEKVFKYVLSEPVDQLTFDANFDESNYSVVLSVRQDCNEPLSELLCVGDFVNPEPTIRLSHPEVGEYYVFVDGGGLELWQPSLEPVALPADPRGFRANADLNDQCWQDGGNDAFDCFGRPALTFDGQSTNLNTRATNGEARRINANGFEVDVESRVENNVWRFTIRPAIAGDDRPVALKFNGDLGSDGNTEHRTVVYPYRGRNFTVLHTSDGGNNDPPTTMFLLTSRPEDAMATQYTVVRDDVTITNASVRLPATLYVALSYAPRAGVAQGILDNIAVEIGGRDADEPTFGAFRLRVTEESDNGGGEPAQGGQPVIGGQSALGGQPVIGGQSALGGQPAAGGESATGGLSASGGQQVAGAESVVGGQSVVGGTHVAGGQPTGAGQPASGGQPVVGGQSSQAGEPGGRAANGGADVAGTQTGGTEFSGETAGHSADGGAQAGGAGQVSGEPAAGVNGQ